MSIKKLFFKNKNKIAGVQVSGTLSERHDHSAEISTNTLESGVTVSNHIHIQPTQLTIEIIVTNTISDMLVNDIPLTSSNSRNKYDELLEVFFNREPFDIQTELKLYKNFVIKNISVEQDVNTANVLVARLELQEIIFTFSEFTNIEVDTIKSEDQSILEKGAPVDEGRK